MKKYLVRKTYTALENAKRYQKGHTEVWFVGKNTSDKQLCDYIIEKGWSRKYFAEKYIESDKDFHQRMKEEFWKIDYEIVEVEVNG